MPAPVVSYTWDDGAVVRFEVEPAEGFRPLGPNEIADKIREAVEPTVEGAQVVLERMKEAKPDEVELRFGIKVSGTASWLVAKAATGGQLRGGLDLGRGPPGLATAGGG
jgi:Trypsin-co-occurring domain 1